MSFFKKLKKDVEVEEEPEEKIEKKIIKRKGEEKKPSFAKVTEGKEEKISITAPKETASDWLKSAGQLAVDVYQSDPEFCVQAPIGGIEQEDIEISIENEMLVIKGERKEPEKDKTKNYFYQECYWGPFSRQIILPEDIDAGRTKAFLRKGILIIKIPRVKKVKKKKISIEAEG